MGLQTLTLVTCVRVLRCSGPYLLVRPIGAGRRAGPQRDLVDLLSSFAFACDNNSVRSWIAGVKLRRNRGAPRPHGSTAPHAGPLGTPKAEHARAPHPRRLPASPAKKEKLRAPAPRRGTVTTPHRSGRAHAARQVASCSCRATRDAAWSAGVHRATGPGDRGTPATSRPPGTVHARVNHPAPAAGGQCRSARRRVESPRDGASEQAGPSPETA